MRLYAKLKTNINTIPGSNNMKLRVFIFFCIFGFTSVAYSESTDSISGVWLGYGYQCYNSQGELFTHPGETIQVYYTDGKVVAKKLIGDACVTSGAITWYIETGEPNILFNHTYSGSIQVGSPSNPNSDWARAKVIFKNANEIHVFGGDWKITMKKERGPM